MTIVIPSALAQPNSSLPYHAQIREDQLDRLEKERFNGKLLRKNLLQFLICIQQNHGWINPVAIQWCSQRLQENDSAISQEEIRGIIDFYSFLDQSPCPPWHLHLSTNVTDYMLGQQKNIDFFTLLEEKYPDRFRVSKTSCSGLCDQGPAGLLNGLPIVHIDEAKRQLIATLIKSDLPSEETLTGLGTPSDNIRQCHSLLSCELCPGDTLKQALVKKPDQLLSEIKVSKLRGRGGAGFPTALKWQTCADMDNQNKVVVCNADEGEPGTFKDRVLLNSHLDQVLDGMTIAAYTVGANLGFIYLRFEYQFLLPAIEKAIKQRSTTNLLGNEILGVDGFDFHIQVHLGAGAYICGEETALIESLEGKRGIPRIRPPFPAQAGYLGYPTIVNNVETFCCISDIAQNGGNQFAQLECEGSTGTKVHSVSGDCEKPGIYELPFSTTVQNILDLVGAKETQAVQVGGPSGKLLFPDRFSEKVNFSHVSSGGSFMVFNHSRDVFEIVKNFTDFFHHESCGFCTPCRVGCGVLSSTLDKFSKHHASDDDILHLNEMMELMDVASHCGLGQTAAHPVRFLLEAKPDFFKQKENHTSVVKLDMLDITSDARALHLTNAMEGEQND